MRAALSRTLLALQIDWVFKKLDVPYLPENSCKSQQSTVNAIFNLASYISEIAHGRVVCKLCSQQDSRDSDY